MQAWGKVRARKRNGRTTYWVDVRPVARIWTTPNGQTFKRRSQAEAVLADIRRAVAVDGKTREAAVSFYLARTSPRLRVGYAYARWIERMRETAARGDCTSSYVDHLERYGRHLGDLADVHYQHVTFARLEG